MTRVWFLSNLRIWTRLMKPKFTSFNTVLYLRFWRHLYNMLSYNSILLIHEAAIDHQSHSFQNFITPCWVHMLLRVNWVKRKMVHKYWYVHCKGGSLGLHLIFTQMFHWDIAWVELEQPHTPQRGHPARRSYRVERPFVSLDMQKL